MIGIVKSGGLIGLEFFPITVEVDVRDGTPSFTLVGLGDKAVQESRERVISAIRSSGFRYTPRKLIANLSPADVPKSGPSFDLPIALAYLVKTGQLELSEPDALFWGELSLDGNLRALPGALVLADGAFKHGIKRLYLPAANAAEAALVPGIEAIGVNTLADLVTHLHSPTPLLFTATPAAPSAIDQTNSLLQFSAVRGQVHAKRALEIAAVGRHNLLLSGVPGAGKTMLAKSLPELLPVLSYEEAIAVSKIYSVAGKLKRGEELLNIRPFRSPHHTTSHVALAGGGSIPRPGEVTLAHHGVLFLDELPEFNAQSLEILRQPIEDKVITIARAGLSVTYPADFMLVAAMNPCKCGFAGDPERECTCTPFDVARYQRKLSGPLLDRIDLFVAVSRVKPHELAGLPDYDTTAMLKRINTATSQRHERQITGVQLEATLSTEATALLHQAAERLLLSARAYRRITRVARTIADLAGSESVQASHISEALTFRRRTKD